MKVHLGTFHTLSKRLFFAEFNGTDVLFLGAQLQGFKVYIIDFEIYQCTSRRCRIGHLWPYVQVAIALSKRKLIPLCYHCQSQHSQVLGLYPTCNHLAYLAGSIRTEAKNFIISRPIYRQVEPAVSEGFDDAICCQAVPSRKNPLNDLPSGGLGNFC